MLKLIFAFDIVALACSTLRIDHGYCICSFSELYFGQLSNFYCVAFLPFKVLYFHIRSYVDEYVDGIAIYFVRILLPSLLCVIIRQIKFKR